MSVEMLSNNSILLMRDMASLEYLQGGQDAAPADSFVKLAEGNLTALQPSLYFQTKTTGITDYWAIKTSTGKWIRVNVEPGPFQDQLQWVAIDPASETVVDKSPFYFKFIPVPLTDSPRLYVLQTFYNGGMTLQRPGGPGTAVMMGPPQTVPGTTPELTFEIGVTSGIVQGLGAANASLIQALPIASEKFMDNIQSVVGDQDDPSSTTTVNGWAIALLVTLGVLALLMLGYLIYVQLGQRSATQVDWTTPSPGVQVRAGGSEKGKAATLARVPTSTLVERISSTIAHHMKQAGTADPAIPTVFAPLQPSHLSRQQQQQQKHQHAPQSVNGYGSFGLQR